MMYNGAEEEDEKKMGEEAKAALVQAFWNKVMLLHNAGSVRHCY